GVHHVQFDAGAEPLGEGRVVVFGAVPGVEESRAGHRVGTAFLRVCGRGGHTAGARCAVASSRCCPVPTARRPTADSAAHMVTWLAASTGLPSIRSSGAMMS